MKRSKLSILLGTFFALTLSGCTTYVSPHNHKLSDWVSDENGHYRTCTICDEVFDLQEHTFSSWKIDKNATCTGNGLKHKSCTVCNYLVEEVIPLLGHDIVEEFSIDDKGHWHTCTHCDEIFDYSEHHYGDWQIDVAASCTENGHQHRLCANCEYIDEEVIPAKGHRWSDEWTIDVQPTCGHDGSKSHHCLDCDAVKDVTVLPTDSNHEHTHSVITNSTNPTCTENGGYTETIYCDDCGELVSSEYHVILATGHSYSDWVVQSEATIYESGYRYRVCGTCGHKDEEVIPQLTVTYLFVDGHLELLASNGVIQKGVFYNNYYFTLDGIMVIDREFFVINGYYYYFINNIFVTGFQMINGFVYYFGSDGVMLANSYIDIFDITGDGVLDYLLFNNEGHLVMSDGSIVIYINEHPYLITGENVLSTATLKLNIIESDDDLNDRNNTLLNNVTCEALCSNETHNTFTNSEGVATFASLPYGHGTLTLSLNGYVTREIPIYLGASSTEMTYALDRDVSLTLNGRVLVADSDQDYTNNQALADASLTLIRVGNYIQDIDPITVYSNSNGNYTFSGLKAGVYQITVHKDGYKDVFDVVYLNSEVITTQNIMIEAIKDDNTEYGSISGQVRDATKQTVTPISGITLRFRSGINITYGEVLYEVTTDSNGNYSLLIAPGNYTIEAVDQRGLTTRYSTTLLIVKVLSNMTLTGQNIAMSPAVNGARIVLTWGSTPSDLDSHTIFSTGTHIYYSNKSPTGYGNLDVDDTSSYGPETTTITNMNYSFTFYVYNFSGGSSYALSNSGAVVKVYIGDGVDDVQYTFNVPYAYGRYWNVFTYKASTGKISFSNTVSSSSPSAPLY